MRARAGGLTEFEKLRGCLGCWNTRNCSARPLPRPSLSDHHPAPALHPALPTPAVDVPEAGDAEPLSRRQLVERRLARAGQLAALYEAELWGLLEELRLRHAQFVAEGRSLHKQASQQQQQQQQRQQQQQQQQGQERAGGRGGGAEPPAKQARRQAQQGSGEAAGAGEAFEGPGAGLRALWQQQQQQAAGGALQAAEGPQQHGQHQQGGAPPAQPRFEDLEALLLSGGAAGLPPVDEAALVEHRSRFVRHLELLGRLEQGALAATCRELDGLGGLAVLCGRAQRYVLRRPCASLGRASGSRGKVRRWGQLPWGDGRFGQCWRRPGVVS